MYRTQAIRGALRPTAAAIAAIGASQLACGRPSAESAESAGSRRDAILEAVQATWTCTASPCPWGASLQNYAIAWPASLQPVATRLGYTSSALVYAPAVGANGATLSIATGNAVVYAGKPADATHRTLATLAAGQSYQVTGLFTDDVLSVQSDAGFRYQLKLPEFRTPPAPPAPPPDARVVVPPRPGEPGVVMRSVRASWRCHKTPGCFSDPWPGAVIAWPEGTAHQGNNRTGNVLRFVYGSDGKPLYPYMGPWANGCEVTAVSGIVAVVEWKYGAAEWRETKLSPGQSYTIQFKPGEDGAMIESGDAANGFTVSVRSCTPKPVAP
jgi:hypothetical protein